VNATYTAPPGGTNDRVYADACGWDPDPSSATYLECIGNGKAGGDVVVTYSVEILSAGTATISGLIYDFSGNSFHYNSDYGVDTVSIVALANADLTISKSDNRDPVAPGDVLVYGVTVANDGPTDATNVQIVDTLPDGFSYVTFAGTGWTCSESGGVVTCTLPSLSAGASSQLDISVSVGTEPGQFSNSVEVTADQADADLTDNAASESTTVNAPSSTVASTSSSSSSTVASTSSSSSSTVASTTTAETISAAASELPYTGSTGPVSIVAGAALLIIAIGASAVRVVSDRRD
jgi:uncharacterized repeat protein (TIGR01451 family)